MATELNPAIDDHIPIRMRADFPVPIRHSPTVRHVYHLPVNHGSLLNGLMQGASVLGCTVSAFAQGSRFARGYGTGKLTALRHAIQADLVVCTYGSSLFDPPWRQHFLLDLPLYSHKAVMIFQGSDARLKYPNEITALRNAEKADSPLPASTPFGIIGVDEIARKRAKIAKAERHCRRMIAVNPDLLSGLSASARYMPYPYSGKCFGPPRTHSGPMRVLHLATNRVLKGTTAIEAAFCETSGIDTRCLVKVPLSEAHAALDWCDVLVDQVGLGWYGYQAVEALARGKPVLCRLDTADWDRHVGRPPELCGFVHVEPHTIAANLMSLAGDPERRAALGEAGQAFVARTHDAVTVVRNAYGDLL